MELISAKDVPCCPQLTEEPCCDRLVFQYRLTRPVGEVAVEVKITAELERCPGPLALGDLVYSTTLLPGERVRLFTASRKNRFTFDSESQVSYRHEQTSEESFYMSAMDRFMSDLSVSEGGGSVSTSQGSFETSGSVSGAIESFFAGPSAEASGSYNGRSTFDFARELRAHAESSHERSVQATRAASSVAVGEVQTRTHAEGESESSFESATRVLENRNRCRAVTYFAYQLAKRQTVRFRVTAITRRVVDPAGDSKVAIAPPRFNGDIAVIPSGVLATNARRVEIESTGRGASVADRAGVVASDTPQLSAAIQPAAALTASGRFATARLVPRAAEPLGDDVRTKALETVDAELIDAGLLDRETRRLAKEAGAELSFEITTCLPTPALLVKGCIDDCDVCEPGRQKEIELDLERKALENKLLERRIEILEKSQEYRCCPAGETEDGADGG